MRLKIKVYVYIYVFLSLILIQACVGVQMPNNNAYSSSYKYNFASLYNPSLSEIHPEIRIFAKSENQALVLYKIQTNEIKNLTNSITDESTKLTIKYTLRDTEKFEVVDSGTVVNIINFNEISENFSSYFTVKTPNQENHKIIISIYGEKANSGKRMLEDIELNQNNELWYLPKIIKNDTEEILYSNFVNSSNSYKISSNIKDSLIKVDYYKMQEHVHLPPYYITPTQNISSKPDSSFIYKINDSIKFNAKGVYFFRKEKQSSGGLCLLNIDNDFPEIKTIEAMLEPLKLLTSSKEYKEIKNSENLKFSIDNFWLSKSQSQKFAKEQIRVFYNRIVLANIYFSEEKEGWKTDKGMIYIMFGPPTVINISRNQEEWFYGEDPDVAGIFFLFDKIETQNYNKSWVLKRDSNYQTIWAQALQTWRQGRIFTISN